MRLMAIAATTLALLAACSEAEHVAANSEEARTIDCRAEIVEGASMFCIKAMVGGTMSGAAHDSIFAQLPVSQTPCASKTREVAEQTLNRVITSPRPKLPPDLVDMCMAAARTQARQDCATDCDIAIDGERYAPRTRPSAQELASARAEAQQAALEADQAEAEANALDDAVVGAPMPQALGAAPTVFEPDSFPMRDSYRFQSATITSISGVGTSNASMTGQVTRADALLYCEADPDGVAAESSLAMCVATVLRREAGQTYRASADCPSRIITAPWGRAYRHVGEAQWRDVETGDNPEDAGMSSGYASLGPIWRTLCAS